MITATALADYTRSQLQHTEDYKRILNAIHSFAAKGEFYIDYPLKWITPSNVTPIKTVLTLAGYTLEDTNPAYMKIRWDNLPKGTRREHRP